MITCPSNIPFFALSIGRLHGINRTATRRIRRLYCVRDRRLAPVESRTDCGPLSLGRCSLQSTLPNLGADYDWKTACQKRVVERQSSETGNEMFTVVGLNARGRYKCEKLWLHLQELPLSQ